MMIYLLLITLDVYMRMSDLYCAMLDCSRALCLYTLKRGDLFDFSFIFHFCATRARLKLFFKIAREINYDLLMRIEPMAMFFQYAC
jgi:hypothetical protein